MKKLSLLLWIVALATSAMSQNVTSAYNANKAGEYDKAVGYIEEALKNPKDAGKEKTWRYRGNIYYNVANGSKFADQFPNASQLALESYFKALEIEPEGGYSEETKLGLGSLQQLVLQQGSTQYNSKDFCKAAENFQLAGKISNKFNIVDSASYFNAAYSFDQCGRDEEAMSGYQKCAEIGYNIPDVYVYMAEILVTQGKQDEAKKLITDARAKHPTNVGLLRLEVNQMLTDQNYEAAEKLLKSLTENDPNNENFWYVLGITYSKLKKTDEAEGAYKKAVELNPNYFEGLFDLGAFYYNKGSDMIRDECAGIPQRDVAKYNDCVSKSMVHFNKSVEFLERAYTINPNDKDLMSNLKEAYIRVENEEGILRLSKALKEAEGK